MLPLPLNPLFFPLVSYSLLGSLFAQHQAKIFFSLSLAAASWKGSRLSRCEKERVRKREESLHIKASTRKVTQGIERKTFLCANDDDDDEEDGDDWEREERDERMAGCYGNETTDQETHSLLLLVVVVCRNSIEEEEGNSQCV